MERYFTEFDKDQNGYLDRHELRLFLVYLFKEIKLNIPLTEEFIDTVFGDIDLNNDGKIDLSELHPYFEDFLERLVELFERALEDIPDRLISSQFYTDDQLD